MNLIPSLRIEKAYLRGRSFVWKLFIFHVTHKLRRLDVLSHHWKPIYE